MRFARTSAYWLVSYTLLILIAGANLATPLYAVYSRTWHFSEAILTLIFATYSLVLIPSLLVFGQLSDHVGRRPVLLAGLIVAACGSALFAAAQGVGWLFAARALQGLAVALISGTATAALTELQPQGRRGQAARLATMSAVAGSAVGPLLAGLLAQYGPRPLLLPYLVQLALLALALLAVWAMPEPRKDRPSGPWRVKPPSIPAAIRAPFAIGSASGFLAWSVGGLYLAMVPTYLGTLLHLRNLALVGATVFLMLGASAIAQFVLHRMLPRSAISRACVLLIVSLGSIVLAVPTDSLVILLISAVLAGCGNGLGFMGGVALVNEVAPAEQRGDVLSSCFALGYIGLGLPVVGVGFGTGWIGLYASVAAFACIIGCIGLAVLVAVRLTRDQAGRETRQQAHAA